MGRIQQPFRGIHAVFEVIQTEQKKYCVYKHTAPNGKVYVGITSQSPKRRFANGNGYSHNEHFRRAITHYGWRNISHDILLTGLDRAEAVSEERRLIALYNSTDYRHGYNLMTGGDGLGTHTEATREKLRVLSTGKKWDDERRQKQAERMLGHTLSAASRAKLSCSRKGTNKGVPLSEEHKRKISESSPSRKGALSNLSRPVRQYDADGNFMREYPAITTAAEANGIASPYNISASINGRQKTCGGYIWRYAEMR